MKSIALLGFGTVGSGVFELIDKNLDDIKNKYRVDIDVTKVLVRSKDKYKDEERFDLFTDSFDEVKESKPDIVVEVMGGIEPAYSYVKYFLENSTHVITANKDLIAEHGEELMNIAKTNNVSLMFEASVGGGIPILKPLKECLGGNRIDSIVAVINGTTNFILSKMYDENMGYDEALKLAQEAGFAESDPTSDVEGLDAGRKISILSSLAYEKRIDWRKVVTKGITKLDIHDITNAKAIKSKIKLLAISKRKDDEVHLSVRPVYVPKNSSIGKIDNEFNGVIIDGDAVGNLMFYGKGAGKLPTASSIFGDLVDIIQNRTDLSNVVLSSDFNLAEAYPIKSKWVLRLMASNINDTIEELFGYFNDITININKSENKTLLFATVDNLTESELENIVKGISSASFVVDKYTLMYE